MRHLFFHIIAAEWNFSKKPKDTKWDGEDIFLLWLSSCTCSICSSHHKKLSLKLNLCVELWLEWGISFCGRRMSVWNSTQIFQWHHISSEERFFRRKWIVKSQLRLWRNKENKKCFKKLGLLQRGNIPIFICQVELLALL